MLKLWGGLFLSPMALAPGGVILGPRFVIFLFGAAALSLAGCSVGGASTWVCLASWLIYISGIVVIFLFFLSSAPNLSSGSPLWWVTSLILLAGALTGAGAVAGDYAGPGSASGPLLFGLVAFSGSSCMVWLGGVLFLALIIAQSKVG